LDKDELWGHSIWISEVLIPPFLRPEEMLFLSGIQVEVKLNRIVHANFGFEAEVD